VNRPTGAFFDAVSDRETLPMPSKHVAVFSWLSSLREKF